MRSGNMLNHKCQRRRFHERGAGIPRHTADEGAAPAAWSKAASERILPAGNLTVQS
jgi:hypothetical protein